MTVLKIGKQSLTIKLSRVDSPKNDSQEVTKQGNVPAEIVKQLDAKLIYYGGGSSIEGSIYNPTQYQFSEFFVQIVIPKSDGFAGLDRVYRVKNNQELRPLTDDFFNTKVNISKLPKGTKTEIILQGATGIIVK